MPKKVRSEKRSVRFICKNSKEIIIVCILVIDVNHIPFLINQIWAPVKSVRRMLRRRIHVYKHKAESIPEDLHLSI